MKNMTERKTFPLEGEIARVFPAGEYLQDELEARGWTQTQFAEIIGRPVGLVSKIVNSKTRITPETAKEIGAALGTSAELWLGLDANYALRITPDPSPEIAERAAAYA